jgi:type II secretory pathway pseudopilin PulG
VEVLVAIVILSLTTIGTVGVINSATGLVRRSGEINELNTLIESDIAAVRSANDRLVCLNGTCAIATTDPGAAGYFPNTANQANVDFFVRLCGYRQEASPPTPEGIFNASAGFVSQMMAKNLLPAVDSRLQRVVTAEDSGHRYTVRYTRAGGDTTILRQITLVPATVAWCPCVPSTTARPCPLTGP